MKLFLKKLFSLLSRHDKKFLVFLLLFSIIISLIETVGIAAIMPFITVAGDFSTIHSSTLYHRIYTFFGFRQDTDFVIAFGIVLIMFYVIRSSINLFYFYMLAKFSKGRYHLLAYRLFENYLGRSYKDFTNENTSTLSKTIINEAQNLTQILSSLLFMISEFFISTLIYSMMLYINWKITLLLSFLLLLNAIFLAKTVSQKIKTEGSRREVFQKKFYEILSTTFGNFKMIKLKSNDEEVLKQFNEASYGYARSNIVNASLSQFPRLFLEALSFIIVIFIIVYLIYKYETNISAAMALISMFILGLYRLMPSINRIFSSYNEILFCAKALDIVHNDLIYEIEELGDEAISFQNSIRLKNVSFAYDDEKWVVNRLSLEIAKGEKIAFSGESGSGKSTLVDLIMGLYRPQKGEIYIDDTPLSEANIKQWRKNIGYIPQQIYLFEGSVAQNVAFDTFVDVPRVKEALKKANILEFLETNHQGVDTEVGENGIKLSGGQKQRIAIARALYNDPEILVLDEATSALDTQTESKIMDEIYELTQNKTMIIIAHRLSTIQKCNKIYRLSEEKNISLI